METSHNNDASRADQFPFGQPPEFGLDYDKPYAAGDPDYIGLGAGDITDEDPYDEAPEPEASGVAGAYDITATDDEPEPEWQPAERLPEHESEPAPEPAAAHETPEDQPTEPQIHRPAAVAEDRPTQQESVPAPEAATEPVEPERKYKSIRRSRNVPGIEEKYTEYVDLLRSHVKLRGETPASDDDKVLLGDIRDGLVAVGDRLDVNLRKRLPAREEVSKIVHLYPVGAQQTFNEEVGALWGEEFTRGDGGLHRVDAGIVWVRRDNPSHNASGLAHELGHEAEEQQFEISKGLVVGPDNKLVMQRSMDHYSGYGVPNPYSSQPLAEVGADMLMHKTLQEIGIPDPLYGYPGLDIIVDAAIRKTADELEGVTVQQVGDAFLRGDLNGSQEGMHLLDRGIGEREMDKLLKLPAGLSLPNAKRIAAGLGLPNAIKVIDDYLDGKGLNLFDWQNRRR
ncbi:MAG TPA: hypothetical protein VGO07_00850 [Candidatus Saccharimonadales bacterium]|jgi:hypothetical protein|nr:hypothetical protein [Candidatus Saccharimonadales bacterium]